MEYFGSQKEQRIIYILLLCEVEKVKIKWLLIFIIIFSFGCAGISKKKDSDILKQAEKVGANVTISGVGSDNATPALTTYLEGETSGGLSEHFTIQNMFESALDLNNYNTLFITLDSDSNGAISDEVWYSSFYTVGGDLGTPSSGTLTNCTGPFESDTSNNFDPDRLNGDTTDDNYLDDAVIDPAIRFVEQDVAPNADPYEITPTTGYHEVRIDVDATAQGDNTTLTLNDPGGSTYEGVIVIIKNVASNTLDMADTAAQQELSSPATLEINESITFQYQDDRWVEIARSTNSLTIASIDIGGGVFVMPNSADPTTDTEGKIAFDSNDDALEVYDGAQSVIVGKKIQQASMTIWDPDTVQATEDAVPLMAVEETWAPFGITITKCWWKSDATVETVVNFEEWAAPDDGAPATIDEVSSVGATALEDSETTISDSAVAAGSIVYVDLDTDALNYLQVGIEFYINPGN